MNINDLSMTAKKSVFAAFAVVVLALSFFATRGGGDDTPTVEASPSVTADNGDTVVLGPDVTASPGTSTGPDGAEIPEMPVDAATVRSTKALATKFAQAYTTYSYAQDDKAVTAALSSMLDKNANLDLTGVIPTGPFKDALVRDRHSTTSTATVTAINTISKNLIAYEVNVTVATSAAGKSSQKSTAYLVTLTRESRWGINDFHPVDTALGSHGND